MFTRLLVGLDGSPGAEAALTAALDLGRRFSSTIVLAAVTDLRALEAPLLGGGPMLLGEGPPALPDVTGLQQVLEERARALLEQAAERVRGAGLAFESVQASGLVADVLLDLVEQAEALVVGRRGEVHVSPGAIGAETSRLMRRSPKPVMVAGERPSPCERPVVAYDGGETSASALSFAARYAEAVGVPVDVVHVTDDVHEGDALLARAGAYLSGAHVEYQTHRLHGPVAPTLAAHVAGTGGDLLLVGAHGGRKRRSWSIGSHAEKLVRATPVPVIIVR